jgi:hypothetical protein
MARFGEEKVRFLGSGNITLAASWQRRESRFALGLRVPLERSDFNAPPTRQKGVLTLTGSSAARGHFCFHLDFDSPKISKLAIANFFI